MAHRPLPPGLRRQCAAARLAIGYLSAATPPRAPIDGLISLQTSRSGGFTDVLSPAAEFGAKSGILARPDRLR